METPAGGSADRRVTGSGASAGAAASGLSRYGLNFSASSLLQAPLAALLEYSGVVPSGPVPQTVQQAVPSSSSSSEADGLLSAAAAGDGEVSIRIQGGPGDPDTASATATGASPQDSIEVAASSNFDPASVAGRGTGADAEASSGGSGGATVFERRRKTTSDLLLAYTIFERRRKIGGIERARERKLRSCGSFANDQSTDR
ncbi:uncharacterized protein LOC119343745 [Triticum dicoccoides]|uniref:uncharacterized protein LOC119343745 n=1 Tax=Triticum dicoccoides TaxID=85692 RepID=UPI00188ECD78|nr:uncharacterized protein LOC119343745 [Triticum dicoccoides]